MNYEQKYLKYKAKYLETKAALDGGLLDIGTKPKLTVNEKMIFNTQQVIKNYNSKIEVLEKAIKGRTNKINDARNRKKNTIENRKKKLDELNEIEEGIKSWDSEIDNIKKEINNKSIELEKQKILLENETTKLNELLKETKK